jgi:heme A synthase
MATPAQSSLKGFSALVGATSLAIFLQSVTAGEFVSQNHREGWIAAHDIVSNVVAVLALATMVFTIVRLRTTSRPLLVGTIVLSVLIVMQIVLGYQITDNKQDWLIGIHVPLALIIFGIAVWLPIAAVALRRAAAKTA